ncbi:hypothetical protein [Haloarcula salinisoli]|uniref:Uncharacterized protein n=1 Tax=Haloarcula salinisoli TaxID=2487746 RepID=A0A8J7YI36_9EURY|nr:hypothetical protein [Halomicroarcula salinisoli]MBX0285079.1 hypothetical protein [Halomicroarcula salinisoli]MBX0303444.1 hypothetical protein [Halomicroarcula salinisoli]
MTKGKKSRRYVLGATAGAATVGLSGCLGVLEEQMSDSSDSEGADEDDDESDDATETGTDENSSDSSVIYADDFEDGTLDSYDIVSIPGDDATETYHITTSPSQGEYAVQHRTESHYMTPTEEVSLEPPLTFSLDFYVDGWSGIDIALQHDAAQNLTYLVKVRDNNNGPFIEVVKKRNEFGTGDSTKLRNDRNENDVFSTNEWETVSIDWETDGTITARISSTGESVSITDDELSGNPFRLVGYHYDGSATFDNVDIRR